MRVAEQSAVLEAIVQTIESFAGNWDIDKFDDRFILTQERSFLNLYLSFRLSLSGHGEGVGEESGVYILDRYAPFIQKR